MLAKFGVPSRAVVDWLTLVGDAVDNVPGVPKVGPKTAAKWLAEYGTLDNVVANAAKIGGVVGENLRAALDWLPQGRRLLTVKTDCELPVGPTDLAIGAPDAETLKSMFARFEFKSWLRDGTSSTPAAPGDVAGAIAGQAARDDGGRRWDEAPGAGSGTGKPAVLDYETVLDEAALERWVRAIASAELACFDTETTSLDPLTAELVGLSFCVEPGKACYVPLAHRYPGTPDQLDRDAVLRRLAPWFGDGARAKLGQNVKFDEHVLANHGVALRGVAHDTLLQSYVLEAHKPHDMDNLAWRHLDWKTIPFVEVCGKGVGQIGFDQVSVERATEYSAEDADVTLRLHQAPVSAARGGREARARLPRHRDARARDPVPHGAHRRARSTPRCSASRAASSASAWWRWSGRRTSSRASRSTWARPSSWARSCSTHMKLPVVKKTATGQPSTDEDVLQELAADYPLPKVLLEHRALSKLKCTYTDKLPQMVNARTGRVHTTFSQATAVTGRLASNDPNLQNIPVRTAEGRRIREAFIAPPGHVLVSADYSQIELRIMAHLSRGRGPAARVPRGRGHPPRDRGRHLRRARAGGDRRAAPLHQGRELRPDLRHGGVRARDAARHRARRGAAVHRQVLRSAIRALPPTCSARASIAREQGYVETVFGRRLWLPDIKAAGGPRRAGAERAAINAPMQGTAADLVKLAMIAVQNWLDEAKLATRLVLQVHDELVLEVPQQELDEVKRSLPGRMTGVAALRVPLVVDVGAGPNWERAH